VHARHSMPAHTRQGPHMERRLRLLQCQNKGEGRVSGARTLQLSVVAVVHVLVRARAAAQEALLVAGLHVREQLVVAEEEAPAEAAVRVAAEAALGQRPARVAGALVPLQVRARVQQLLRDEHLPRRAGAARQAAAGPRPGAPWLRAVMPSASGARTQGSCLERSTHSSPA